MHVKIDTEAVWDGERIGVGSVIDVTAETFELNKSWMKATDAPLKKIAPAPETAKPTDQEK